MLLHRYSATRAAWYAVPHAMRYAASHDATPAPHVGTNEAPRRRRCFSRIVSPSIAAARGFLQHEVLVAAFWIDTGIDRDLVAGR